LFSFFLPCHKRRLPRRPARSLLEGPEVAVTVEVVSGIKRRPCSHLPYFSFTEAKHFNLPVVYTTEYKIQKVQRNTDLSVQG
jgi:hypothetical protein